ncbi:MAG: TonB C-terminal domain-containing protein [bacterium]|nr:TonB C-terminal domain-containing protein [bacterium]
MKFKFRIAVILSVVLHISLFALAVYVPRMQKSGGTIYYVDLMQLPGGGGSGGLKNDTQGQLVESGSVRDLTVKKKIESKLRYPDAKKKKASPKKKKKKEKLISVVKRKNNNKFKKDDSKAITTQRKTSDGLRTGIASGSGGGSGGGTGSGSGPGFGDGIGGGNFPYAYYISTLRGKISASWYSSLVSPGLKGKYVAVVYFRITRSGRVSQLDLESKSGNNSLDLSALRAIRAAAPFPQLPPDFPGQYLGVHFEFVWER